MTVRNVSVLLVVSVLLAVPDCVTAPARGQDKARLPAEIIPRNRIRHDGTVCSASFSPDGKTLASASFDKTVKLWEVATGKELATLQGHTAVVWSVSFSPGGKTLTSASGDKTVKLWEAATGKELATLRGHTGTVVSAR